MSSMREMRHRVLMLVVSYAQQHMEDYPLFMRTNTVLWMLMGRPNLHPDARLAMLNSAHDAVVEMMPDHDQPCLYEAHLIMHQMIALEEQRQSDPARNTDNPADQVDALEEYKADFSKWEEAFNK